MTEKRTALNDNVIIQVFLKLCMLAVEFYKDHIYPAHFERAFILNGVRIRMSIEPYVTADDTQPVFQRLQIRDEDDQIAD